MLKRRKILRVFAYVTGGFLVLVLVGIIYLVSVASLPDPAIKAPVVEKLRRTEQHSGVYAIGNNWIVKNRYGLYEMYVEGAPYERGVINGKLSAELVQRQEMHFNDQINRMIPSTGYKHFLRYFIGWFNRNLDENVTDEYKQEIFGISKSASHEFDYIGSNYQRILNYHAAHDIGHALQSMALVGCTSFGTWGERSADGSMIIGRNFDFYVGDKFAEDKIVSFVKPASGYRFMSITWGGFVGVVSGMNEKGLTVTINAAKTDMPSGSATPVSLVAREILQYAKNIAEAEKIARQRKMFVSESFLIGSAFDGKAVVLEKTPDSISVYDPQANEILCANHFQSEGLKNSPQNIEQLNESASVYRYKRLKELMSKEGKNTIEGTAKILRDRYGMSGQDIGMGNEKAINQLIAHHSVIFQPEKRRVWISTSHWQLGSFVCYDLDKVFATPAKSVQQGVFTEQLTIAADSFLQTTQFQNFQRFRELRSLADEKKPVDIHALIESNPEFYHTYVLAGNQYFRQERFREALDMYRQALKKEVATKKEKDHINEQIGICLKKLDK